MDNTDNNDQELYDNDKEYLKLLSELSSFVTEHPEIISSLRDAIKTSASLMVSNIPEAVSDFRELAEEADSFLRSCQSGEINPESFIIKDDEDNK